MCGITAPAQSLKNILFTMKMIENDCIETNILTSPETRCKISIKPKLKVR